MLAVPIASTINERVPKRVTMTSHHRRSGWTSTDVRRATAYGILLVRVASTFRAGRGRRGYAPGGSRVLLPPDRTSAAARVSVGIASGRSGMVHALGAAMIRSR